ncbi:MAG: circularly permuted type 2 ATP-grasp protein, partial [Pseudonocardiaceae bacterium]
MFADLFRDLDIHPVDSYPNRLQELLAALAPRRTEWPTIAVLTPGVYNSAYFEHVFLARQMGAYLVEGSDLIVDDDCVYVGTVSGPVRVDVIYRRIDDQWLDPEVFRPDSLVGVPGLIRAWRAGTVAIANAPGAGVADDKAVYAFVPALIRYYLGEDPKIANVPTYLCCEVGHRAHVSPCARDGCC